MNATDNNNKSINNNNNNNNNLFLLLCRLLITASEEICQLSFEEVIHEMCCGIAVESIK